MIKKQFHLSIQDFSKVKAYLFVQLWWIIYENSRFWSGHHTVVIHDVSLDFIILEEPRLILTANIQYLWTTYHDYYTILKKDTFMIWTYNFKISRSDLTNKTIHVELKQKHISLDLNIIYLEFLSYTQTQQWSYAENYI